MKEISKEQQDFLDDLARSKKESEDSWQKIKDIINKSKLETELIILKSKNEIDMNKELNKIKKNEKDLEFIFIMIILFIFWVIFSIWGF